MIKREFEELAKIAVSDADYYGTIEPMYMATDLTKEEFIKTLNLKYFALKSENELINQMKKCSKSLKESCGHYTDNETREKLEMLRKEYESRFVTGWCFFDNAYEFDQIGRGCTYPCTLVVVNDGYVTKKITLC